MENRNLSGYLIFYVWIINQDYNNREVDAVIELEEGRWCAFKVKLGANQIDEAASSLLKLQKSLNETGAIAPEVLCVICGLSNAAYKCEDGVFVVPVCDLGT